MSCETTSPTPREPAGRKPLRLRTRLMLSIVGVLVTALGAGLIWSHEALELVLADRDNELLRRKASELRAAALDPDTGSFETLLDELQRESEVFESEGMTVVVWREDQVLVMPESDAAEWLSEMSPTGLSEAPRSVYSPEGEPFRVVSLEVVAPDEPPYRIDIGLAVSRTRGLLRQFDRRLLTGATVLLALAVGGAVALSRRALQPVADGIFVARQLDPDDLRARLPMTGAGDELDQLNATINGLLDRITATHERMTRFTADASHELRGPLASMRSLIDVTLQHTRPTDEYREAIGSLGETCDRMTSMVNALLTLARADSGMAVVRMASLDLTGLVTEIAEFYQPLAEDNGQTLDVQTPDGDVIINGDADLLRQLISNLLSNAFRFTPSGGRVTLALRRQNDTVRVAVHDTGPGIAESDLANIFDRFYQSDTSRSQKGTGLGLSICRWITTSHGGTITASNKQNGGCAVEATLPCL